MRGRRRGLERFARLDVCEARVHPCFAYLLIKGSSKGVGVGSKAGAHGPFACCGQQSERMSVEEDRKRIARNLVNGFIVPICDDRKGPSVFHQEARVMDDAGVPSAN